MKNVSVKKSSIRTIKSGDPKFYIQDTFVTAPRAGFELASKMPGEYRMIIQTCLNNGWLKPVANIKDTELFWEEFSR